MFNSCTFNSVKFNSICIPQVVPLIAPPTGGEARVRERKRRLFRREFIDIVGKKLFFNIEFIDIIGIKLFFNKEFIDIVGIKLINDKQFSDIISSILLPVKTKINLTSKVLSRNEQDLLVLKGKVQHPIKIETELIGAKKFPKCMYQIIKGKRLILCKQLELIYGKKLILSTENKALMGCKKVPCKQINLIKGRKDISEILEVLDILEKEE